MSLIQIFKDIEQNEWIDIPKGWLQGRTIFGGLVAGLLMHKAVATINDPSKHLLSVSVTFVGPVQEAKVRLTAEILRQGKSVTTIEVRLWQDDAVQSILLASFGRHRESSIHVRNEIQAPDYPTVDELKILPKNAFAPQCFQQFELAWAEGHYPCSGSEKPDFGGWFRFDPELHENRTMSVADLMTLFDVWPPGVLPMFKSMLPASTLTWHVTYVHPIQHQIHDWFKYKVVTEYAGDGYATEYAHIWDADNRLIAISRQTVTVFA
ncbi:thioesterase family protein [Acinetobacter sp. ANC 4648]|uniref:thioesterase family protein n=1 Tax=Acinetobacter sp. ANC 4648 TaxID=1977875 RepID=UPI000A3491B9|nr:thioesterase family protein [Acinetobacter sp. ANC 4648]OTG80728.1 acyl-CoA thioesterase [Acinetobacter sp. ANC 4648]